MEKEKAALKKKALALLACLLALVILVAPARAWGPNTHVTITKQALTRSNSSIIVQQVQAYPDAFYCGLLFPDISVLYYYTQFEDYRATHNWLFYRRLLEEAATVEEKAFAYGVAVHIIQDSVAHNDYVPAKIRETSGSNFYTHPLVEAAVEKHYFDLSTSGALEKVDRYLPLANQVLGRDVSDMAYTFRSIVRAGAFYTEAYAPPEVPFWDLYETASGLVQGLYGVDDCDDYIERAVVCTVRFLETGETPTLDPSGIEALSAATNYSNTVRFAWTFALALGALAVISFWRKKRSRKGAP